MNSQTANRPSIKLGMTLLELLVVMALMVTLLGLSASIYVQMSKRFKDQGAAASLELVLRQARNAALAANAPAFVELDAAEQRVVGWRYRTVGLWHFESMDEYGRSPGAYHEATLRGAKIFKEGKIGKCAQLGPRAYVDLGASPEYDLVDGGYLEAWVRLPAGYLFTGEDYIFYKKNSYYLKIGRGGTLLANAGQHGDLKSLNYRVCAGRWLKLAFAWDRHSTHILVDDAVVGRALGSKPLVSDHPLLIGHEDSGDVPLLVDEVRVMAAEPAVPLELPASCTLQHNTAPWDAIYFAADGTLDMHYHPGPVSVSLLDSAKKRTVTVSMLGQTTRLEVEAQNQEKD
jgi:competence protein ComGC